MRSSSVSDPGTRRGSADFCSPLRSLSVLGLTLAWAATSAAAAGDIELVGAIEQVGDIEQAVEDRATPRTLILALDGIPYRVVEQARAQGAFENWPATSRLVAPFPSLTNVSFTAMLQPFGVEAAPGYEIHHFDLERNRVVGGTPIGYAERAFAWRDAFDVVARSFRAELAAYAMPGAKSRSELDDVVEALEMPDCDPVLAHVLATDALQHLRGDETVVRFLLRLHTWIRETQVAHRARHGRDLRVVLLSDHGNGGKKIRSVGNVRKRLRRAGLRVTDRLERPGDVVAPTFGVVSYGALFLADENDAETAARAIAGHAGVDLAAWREAPHEVRVASASGMARILWRGDTPRRQIAYLAGSHDPLRLNSVLAALRVAGRLGDDGFADEADWLNASAAADFPDAPRRLVDAFSGDDVANQATVIFSLAPGRAWGWRSAHIGSWFSGGRIETTHGGLDREATLGFMLTDDPDLNLPAAVTAESALSGLDFLRDSTSGCRLAEVEKLRRAAYGPVGSGTGAAAATP